MSDLRELYQQVILDHNKNPRNFHELPNATRAVDGYNPLCGDHYKIYVEIDGNTIKDIGFTGNGCAISKASASVMSSSLKGKTTEEAHQLFDVFGVSEFPARVKCASLPWHTLNSAIEGDKETVSTE
jgi:nitrogen fixation NifU-like protein